MRRFLIGVALLLIGRTAPAQCADGACGVSVGGYGFTPYYVSAPMTTAVPLVYYRADVSGRVWYHANPAYLERYIALRNARMVGPMDPIPTGGPTAPPLLPPVTRSLPVPPSISLLPLES